MLSNRCKGDHAVPRQRSEILHATALSINGNGVLLIGKSGSGKSDLALRCLSLSTGPFLEAPFQLVSDDQSVVTLRDEIVTLKAPDTIAGKLEVRGVGIMDVPFANEARLCLVAQLIDGEVERHPALNPGFTTILGKSFYSLSLRPFEVSAPIKLALALREQAALPVPIEKL